jgi:hypothetical protein
MTIETEELLALSDVMSAKRMREMEDEIFRLESEVQQWKESANSCQMQVSLLREEPNQRMHDGCLVLSYNKLRDALERISDFSLSSTLSAILLHCLPHWATAEDSDKVAKLVTLFPIEIEDRCCEDLIPPLPTQLTSEDALELKERLMEVGLINESWQPLNLSWSESALMAQKISDNLAIKDTWRVFGRLWGKKPETLRGFYNRSLDQKKSLVFQERLKEVI